MGEGLLAGDVPAGTAVRRGRPDSDVALLVGALLPGDLVVLEVGLRRRLARVDDHHQGGVGDYVVRDVGVPIGGVKGGSG